MKKIFIYLLPLCLITSCNSSESDKTTDVKTVTSKTGRIWMDRNLGATQVATSPTDEKAFGDLYQYGRGADGHEKRDSQTFAIPSEITFSGKYSPEDFIEEVRKLAASRFIEEIPGFISSEKVYGLVQPKRYILWEGTNKYSKYCPCPDGYRLPTNQEWVEEIATWSSKDSKGAIESPLKLTLAGYRQHNGIKDENITGNYWSTFGDLTIKKNKLNRRKEAFYSVGESVRCIKE